MELPIVVAVLILAPAYLLAAEDNNVVYAAPTQSSMNIRRRDTASQDTLQSIHKSLMQHTETLEKMMSVVKHNEELAKSIIEHLNEKVEPDTSTHRVEIHHPNRRSNDEDKEIPIVKFGKDIVRYGNLLKTVIMSDITKDPKLTVEENHTTAFPSFQGLELQIDENVLENSERELNFESEESRSNHGYATPEQSGEYYRNGNYNHHTHTEGRRQSNANSLWCAVAIKCHESLASVCGLDDNVGLAKFNNVCHMLQINCYWNYNFSIAPCRRVMD